MLQLHIQPVNWQLFSSVIGYDLLASFTALIFSKGLVDAINIHNVFLCGL